MKRHAQRDRQHIPKVAPTNGHIGCSGKRQYHSFIDATHVASVVRRHKGGDRMSAYRCRFCRSWHIGSGDKFSGGARVE